jgi:hypothetical protein
MGIIESFQAFKNFADRTFRGGFLGRQEVQKPKVDTVERGIA